ncbi:hypothetical protein BUPH_08261 (plasmid) [Paraburkholderia phenoliruptrix BR3459a]|uniref:Uncharacterized protein n=1 Tax=Paraburkholderia phenoliruptrix BR3459a TaxID=1229205 RepID=K0E065_9BURK|nr:hypothetical protein BUPH_08261 [Paraburkholderia phenoliruptrix BR3459a]
MLMGGSEQWRADWVLALAAGESFLDRADSGVLSEAKTDEVRAQCMRFARSRWNSATIRASSPATVRTRLRSQYSRCVSERAESCLDCARWLQKPAVGVPLQLNECACDSIESRTSSRHVPTWQWTRMW